MQRFLPKNRKIVNRQIVNHMTFSEFWTSMRIGKWWKYVLTVVIFLVVYLFVGEQSMLHFWHRHREIKRLEEQRDMYNEGAARAEQEIILLQNPDSLERYAREHYYMHTANEDIYLVNE